LKLILLPPLADLCFVWDY